AVSLERKNRDPAGAPARLASVGETHAGGWQTGFRLAVRFWPVLLPQCRGADRVGHWSVFLSAKNGEPFGGAPLERRVLFQRAEAWGSSRHNPGHGPDRDHSGRF